MQIFLTPLSPEEFNTQDQFGLILSFRCHLIVLFVASFQRLHLETCTNLLC